MAIQRRKVVMRSSVEREYMAQQRGKSSHSAAEWKESTWRTSVEKVVIVQQSGKKSLSAAAFKK